MAINTQDKRQSCIGIGLPVPQLGPVPDSLIDDRDWQNIGFCYSGIDVLATSKIKHKSAEMRRRRWDCL